jgi:hypothetical protein
LSEAHHRTVEPRTGDAGTWLWVLARKGSTL